MTSGLRLFFGASAVASRLFLYIALAGVYESAMLRFEGVVKQYQRRGVSTFALNGLSLELRRGEFVAVMGPSGSGKSTLLHLAAALDLPTCGSVLLDGRATVTLSEEQRTALRRRRIGLVFQFFNLLPTLPVHRNIALPLLLDGRPAREFHPRVEALLERIGLRSRAAALPDELSGGEMQRVAIARALVTQPELLLADEPTGNLDTASSQQVLSLIHEFARADGRSTLLVTHDPQIAAQADRVIHLLDGRVDGTRPPVSGVASAGQSTKSAGP